MNQAAIRKRFEKYLRSCSLKLTSQRERIFERVFSTHEHFSAETLYSWMQADEAAHVSRATVYRTLSLLVQGGFVVSMNNAHGEVVYEHILGHAHHDHLICIDCGRIDEFQNTEIEALQIEAARKKGYALVRHTLRLEGRCSACQKLAAKQAKGESKPSVSS